MSGVKGSLSASNSVKVPELRGRLDQVSSMQGTLSNTFLRGLSAYQEALLSGFDGTRDEWLESLKGAEVLLRENENNIEWKYSSEEEWKHLISLEPTRDYDKLINKPTLNGSELSESIDEILDEWIRAKIENGDYSLSEEQINKILFQS